VALTFDDGPDPVWTPLVLDALGNAGAQATFFVVAPRAARYPSLVSYMQERGHNVAFHCSEHVRHDSMTRRDIEAHSAGDGPDEILHPFGHMHNPLLARSHVPHRADAARELVLAEYGGV
jgi:hypothetical protein